MLIVPEQTCATCIWWERMGPKLANALRDPGASPEVGTCQQRAPIVVQGNAPFPVSMFPETHESRFCGDWEGMDDENGGGGSRTIVPFALNQLAA